MKSIEDIVKSTLETIPPNWVASASPEQWVKFAQTLRTTLSHRDEELRKWILEMKDTCACYGTCKKTCSDSFNSALTAAAELIPKTDECPIHSNKTDYKCPYCGEMTAAGTFHESCYAEN